MHIPKFIKIGSDIQKLMEEVIDKQTEIEDMYE
jgi:hypothetical protein